MHPLKTETFGLNIKLVFPTLSILYLGLLCVLIFFIYAPLITLELMKLIISKMDKLDVVNDTLKFIFLMATVIGENYVLIVTRCNLEVSTLFLMVL